MMAVNHASRNSGARAGAAHTDDDTPSGGAPARADAQARAGLARDDGGRITRKGAA